MRDKGSQPESPARARANANGLRMISGGNVSNLTASVLDGQIERDAFPWAFVDGFLFLAIVSGNALAIHAMVASKTTSRVASNRFVLSLAVSDLLVGATVLYHILFYISPRLGQVFVLCIVRLSLISLACAASVFNILGIAIDRYVAIVHPLRYHKIITKRSSKLISLAGWILALAVSTVPTYWNTWDGSDSATRCEMGHIVHPLYVITLYAPIFFVLYIGMCVLYLKIIREARSHARRMSHLTKDRHYSWKSIQVLTLVLGSFTISYVPFVVIVILNSIFQRKSRALSTVYRITSTLAVANSAVNPIIYAWKNQELKKTICSVTRCKTLKHCSDELI